jgi:hypothetical protein
VAESITLYLGLKKGEKADFKIVGLAAAAFAEAVKEIAFILEPGLQVKLEFESGLEGSLKHGSAMERGLRPFCGSAKLATMVPWLLRKDRSHAMRRAARYSTISMTMWPRPLVLAVDGRSALRRH